VQSRPQTDEAARAWGAVRLLQARVPQGVDAGLVERAQWYVGELGRWSAAVGLTGYRNEAARTRELVGGSLLYLVAAPESESPLLDIGSGSGAPGLILAMARPQWAVTLIDAKRRSANFLRHVVRELGLPRVEVIEGRAESAGRQPRLQKAFMTVTLRAVANWPEAESLAHPFVAPGGQAIIALGPRARPTRGMVRAVAGPALRQRRRFLILVPGRLSDGGVPRGTRGPQ
jgi:16S rRNA (guanine527-N7)-methyltransferase